VLGRIPRLPKLVVAQIVTEFGGLDELLAATDPELEAVEGVGEIRAKDIREGLRRLQEINLVDRYLQTWPRAAKRPAATKEDTIPPQATEEATLIDALEATREVEYIEFELGDHVVYPHHGAGKVLKKEEMEMLGERREYLTIKILHNDMTVRVPTENAALAGLRRVIDEETVKKVLDVLRDAVSEMPKNWNRRFKHNRDKIKTGDIYELAEVVRNLSLRESEKGLSTGEKQMFTRTKKILASELMYALDKDEEEAESYLDDLLADSATSQMAVAGAE
jgi:CarD family transcriptional regulator